MKIFYTRPLYIMSISVFLYPIFYVFYTFATLFNNIFYMLLNNMANARLKLQ